MQVGGCLPLLRFQQAIVCLQAGGIICSKYANEAIHMGHTYENQVHMQATYELHTGYKWITFKFSLHGLHTKYKLQYDIWYGLHTNNVQFTYSLHLNLTVCLQLLVMFTCHLHTVYNFIYCLQIILTVY